MPLKLACFWQEPLLRGEKSLDTGEREKKTTTFKGSQGATATHIPLLRTMGQYPFLKEHFNFHCQNFHEIFMYLKKIPKLIGVQRNHGVEYVGGPAAPT